MTDRVYVTLFTVCAAATALLPSVPWAATLVLLGLAAILTALELTGSSKKSLDSLRFAYPSTLRVTLQRVDEVRGEARFTSHSEDEPFTLLTLLLPKAVAQALHEHIGEEIAVTGLLERDPKSRILSGVMLKFEPLEKGDPVHAWTQWLFEPQKDPWSKVPDIEREIDREASIETTNKTKPHDDTSPGAKPL